MIQLKMIPLADDASTSRSVVELALVKQGMQQLVPKLVTRF